MIMEFNKTLDNGKNYANPPIPTGYTRVSNNWEKGLTIKDGNGNYSVWIPVGAFLEYIDTNVSKDNLAINFNDSIYVFKHTSKKAFEAYKNTPKYLSTLKYGGFYIGMYPISTEYTSKPNSTLLTNVSYFYFKKFCKNLGYADVSAEMLYETEHDLLIMWLLLSGILSEYEIYTNSSSLGIYLDDNIPIIPVSYILSAKSKQFFNISHLCGFLWEVVQGIHYFDLNSKYTVAVSGCWYDSGCVSTLGSKKYILTTNLLAKPSLNMCSRHTLLIK